MEDKTKNIKQLKYGRFLIDIINSMETVAVNDDNCDIAEKIQKESLIKLEKLINNLKV